MEGSCKKSKSLTWNNFIDLRKDLKIKEALDCLLELCQNNDPLALVQLGRAYFLGLYGLTVNKALSFKYLRQSNHPIACYYLHKYHKYGKRSEYNNNHYFLQAFSYLDDSKPHDYSKEKCTEYAIELFKLTAEKCYIYEAYNHLAQIDKSHRVKHLKKGAFYGDEQCQLDLSIYYESKHLYNKAWPYIKQYWKQCPTKRVTNDIFDELNRIENVNTVCNMLWCVRFKGDELWFLPKDILKIILNMVWNTREDKLWEYL